jgi:hypothetical protein
MLWRCLPLAKSKHASHPARARQGADQCAPYSLSDHRPPSSHCSCGMEMEICRTGGAVEDSRTARQDSKAAGRRQQGGSRGSTCNRGGVTTPAAAEAAAAGEGMHLTPGRTALLALSATRQGSALASSSRALSWACGFGPLFATPLRRHWFWGANPQHPTGVGRLMPELRTHLLSPRLKWRLRVRSPF